MKRSSRHNMRKATRGDSLVEVLVALSVFALICTLAFGMFFKMPLLPSRQEESIRAEMLCRDIALYSDRHGREWVKLFETEGNPELEHGEILLDADFKVSTNAPIYKLTYNYTDSKELVVSIFHIESGREVVTDLNYGNKRYIQ